jgi:polysaccharide deacetylase 2 family uncharacterized protein YibQ
MARHRVRRIRVLLAALGLVALAVTGLGTLVALWAPRATASVAGPTPGTCTPANPCLAVVIDDVGREMEILNRLLALELNLSFGILPHARYTEESLRAIRARGREVLLHLPMVPLDAGQITDEAVVLGRDGPLEPALRDCLARVPGAVGTNNHMGSLLSRDPRAVARILREVKARSMWFLDSRTTAGSLFCAEARKLGVPCVERDLFLDDPPREDEIRFRLRQASQIANERGWSVVIGHPGKGIVDALQTYRVQTSITMVPVSVVVERVSLVGGM